MDLAIALYFAIVALSHLSTASRLARVANNSSRPWMQCGSG